MQTKSVRKGTTRRLLKMLLEFYPVKMPLTIFCILFSAVVSSVPAIFMQNVIALVESSWQSGDWSSVGSRILGLVGLLALFYVLSLISGLVYNPVSYTHLDVYKRQISKFALIPRRVTMDRANFVACSMSLDAPEVKVPKINSSAARPPVYVTILLNASSFVTKLDSPSSTCMV